MKNTRVIFFLLPALLACTPKKSKEELSHLDPSSPDNFIRSVVDNRKDTYADSSDYDIFGKTVFSNGDFHILNFSEIKRKDTSTYAIVLNQILPEGPARIDSTDKSPYAGLQNLLKKQTGLTYWVVEGNIEPSKDFQGDGTSDFVLTQISTKANQKKSRQEILLYDGKRKLAGTAISAVSAWQEDQNNFTGVKETFEFKGAAPVTLIVHHWEDSSGLKFVRYDKTWRWSGKDTTWQTGLIGTDLDKSSFKKFTQRLTYLENNAGTFTIPENCQSGGPIYFELKRSDPSELSDYYLVKTGIEDAGYNIVFQLTRKDSSTYVLYKARGEKPPGPNRTGKTEIQHDSADAMIIIKNDPVRRDIYWLTYSYSPVPLPYTSAPKKYRFVKCQ